MQVFANMVYFLAALPLAVQWGRILPVHEEMTGKMPVAPCSLKCLTELAKPSTRYSEAKMRWKDFNCSSPGHNAIVKRPEDRGWVA